jgi:bacterioferritin-associated ferredoxin
MISETVMGAIAHIEMHRQEMAKETSVAAACNEALRKLHELLDGERERLQSLGPGAEHAENIEAVMAEIERVKRLAGASGKGAMPRHEGAQRLKRVGPGQPHNRPRTKGRRTMGRTGGR